MSETSARTLLPEGLRDFLPPEAGHEADLVQRLTRSFAANGYALVKPPLLEFEDSLVSGVGAGVREHIFRLTDPVSHKTLGLRADVTTQVARIAATRLAGEPRPLRLMYAGPVLRVRGSQLEPERQFTQVGIELIGSESAAADVEVIVVLAEALRSVGVDDVTVDLSLPTLVPAVLAATPGKEGLDDRLRTALDHKDVAEIKACGGAAGSTLTALVEASGLFEEAKRRIGRLSLAPAAAAAWRNLVAVADAVAAAAPRISLTVDAVENRGFEYHSGITFSVFARGASREIGRGGRYRLGSAQEAATGATLLVDALAGVAPQQPAPRRLFAPAGTPRATVAAWQAKGWQVVSGLDAAAEPAWAARALACSHVLTKDEAVTVGAKS